jgi:hypothetical protein
MRDEMFPTAGYRDAYRRLGEVYALYDARDHIALYEHDAPHQDIPAFRKEADEWLSRWLRDDRTPFNTGTIERETPEALRVLDKYPASAINDHIDRAFVSTTNIPAQTSLTGWERRKTHLTATLRGEVFAAFPAAAPAPEAAQSPNHEWTDRYADAHRVEFTTEPGLRLSGQLYTPQSAQTAGALLWLEGDDDLIDAINHDRILPALGRLRTLVLRPRGVGYDLDRRRLTTIKRSVALLGATLESMQVWDALRGVDYLLANHSPALPVTLFARRSMGAVGIYAAALDSRISRVVLEDPPSTHWNGPAMMNVLRTTDLAEVAGMIAPRQLVFLTRPAEEYQRTRAIYRLHRREQALRVVAGFSEALELR